MIINRIVGVGSWLVLLLAALIAGAGFRPARASFIATVSEQTVEVPAGNFHYEYTVAVGPDSDATAFIFQVELGNGVAISNPAQPDGWTPSHDADLNIMVWESEDPAFDLLPGETGHFSFTSTFGPGLSSYLLIGINEQTLDFTVLSSESVAPVPEPPALVMAGLAPLALVARRLHGRRWR